MSMSLSVWQKLSNVLNRSASDDVFFDHYEPKPLSRPQGAWTDEAVQDQDPFAATPIAESERLESRTLSMIRGALYAAE